LSEYIPLYQPFLDKQEEANVLECIRSSWISSKGNFVTKFEKDFSQFTNIEYSVSVSNGTTALHSAILALGISDGDEVIVPTFTYIASVNAINYVGAVPVFCDIDPSTWQIDHKKINSLITSKTKAIMVVHLYGHPSKMDEIVKIAKEKNIFVIEDCAEAFGSIFQSQMVGGFGDISTFSFYGNKTITTGEGGMVCTNNPDLAQRVYDLKNQGVSKNREYWHDSIGYNYRMTNLCAAIGCAQIEKANWIIEKKRELAYRYFSALKGTPLIFLRESNECKSSFWMVSALATSENENLLLRKFLKDNLVETRPLFPLIHTMPIYQEFSKYTHAPIASMISAKGLNLPSWPTMSEKIFNKITDLILLFYENQGDNK
jgi:perosamine synthetase